VALAAAGHSVAVNYNSGSSAADAAETVQLCEQASKEAGNGDARYAAIQANVALPEQCEELMAAVATGWGAAPAILVNNAGITRDNLIMRMPIEDFDAVLATNLRSTFLLCRLAVRPMIKARWGRIVNIASIVGLQGNAGQTNYAASKAGIIGLSKSLAREVAARGVTVNAVAPGFIRTKMTDVLAENTVQAMLATIPLGRAGEPADIANAVTFLASDQANYITGQTLAVDGGMTM
jgi:3-oxoacyl-[acyl-carrier protein] reductase